MLSNALIVLLLALASTTGATSSTSFLRSSTTESSSSQRRRTQGCPFANYDNHLQWFFTIDISYTPQGGFDTSQCTDAKKTALEDATNALLHEHGQDGGLGDGVYDADICEADSETRRQLQFGFVYRGGGQCSFCYGDNNDGRKLQVGRNWFTNEFQPEMQNLLRNSLTRMAHSHTDCLGNGPQIQVTVTEVEEAEEIEAQCPTTTTTTSDSDDPDDPDDTATDTTFACDLELGNYAVVAEQDATVSGGWFNSNTGLVVGQTLIDGSPDQQTRIDGDSFVGYGAAGLKWNFNGGIKYGVTSPSTLGDFVNMEDLKMLSLTAVSAVLPGGYEVVVVNQGGTYTMADLFPGKSQWSQPAKYLAIFNTDEDVTLEKGSTGSEIGFSTLAPYSKLTVKSDVNWVLGFLVGREVVDGSGGNQGVNYEGPLQCS